MLLHPDLVWYITFTPSALIHILPIYLVIYFGFYTTLYIYMAKFFDLIGHLLVMLVCKDNIVF